MNDHVHCENCFSRKQIIEYRIAHSRNVEILGKYDSAGIKQWSIINDDNGTDTPRRLCVDAAGTYIYIVGDFTSSISMV